MLAGAFIITLNSLAVAGPTDTTNVDKRQVNQEKRIKQGIKSGQLTEKEADRLGKQQQRIQKAEDAAKADGQVTKQERKKLNKMQDNASKDIYKAKHNKKTANQ